MTDALETAETAFRIAQLNQQKAYRIWKVWGGPRAFAQYQKCNRITGEAIVRLMDIKEELAA